MKTEWYNCILEDQYGRADIKALQIGDKYYGEDGKELKLVISSRRVRRVIDERPAFDPAEEAGKGHASLMTVIFILAIVAMIIGWMN